MFCLLACVVVRVHEANRPWQDYGAIPVYSENVLLSFCCCCFLKPLNFSAESPHYFHIITNFQPLSRPLAYCTSYSTRGTRCTETLKILTTRGLVQSKQQYTLKPVPFGCYIFTTDTIPIFWPWTSAILKSIRYQHAKEGTFFHESFWSVEWWKSSIWWHHSNRE